MGEAQTRPAADDAFEEIIRPLELASRERLDGPGLDECRQAFAEDPEGFARVAEIALARGRHPLGLLVKLVRQGKHRLDPASGEQLRELRRRLEREIGTP